MKQIVKTYQQLLSEYAISHLRTDAAIAEVQGKLTEGQLEWISTEGWFKFFVPNKVGGLALDLPQAVRLEEAIAYVDGSLGWTVTLCAGAVLFVGFMDPEIVPDIVATPDVCFAGSGQSLGIAVEQGRGYLVSGQWPYATGLPHSQIVTANCRVVSDKGDAADADSPIKTFYFHCRDVEMIFDWDTMGLRATASHSFRVNEVWVPQSHVFSIDPSVANYTDPIYRYPFGSFSEITLAVNTLGMTMHLLEACQFVWEKRNRNAASVTVFHDAVREVRGIRSRFYELVDRSWERHLNGEILNTAMEERITQTSRQLVAVCQSHAAKLYPHTGMEGARSSSDLNRTWRDLFTASQHSMLR